MPGACWAPQGVQANGGQPPASASALVGLEFSRAVGAETRAKTPTENKVWHLSRNVKHGEHRTVRNGEAF